MKRFSVLLVLLMLAMLPAQAVLASPHFNRTVIADGEVVNDDIEVFGEELTIEAGAVVNGDVTVFGGNADIAGTVDGSIAVLGGNVSLSGPVGGDIMVLGGNLDLGAETTLDGECMLLGGNLTNNAPDQVSCTSSGDFAVPFLGNIMQDDARRNGREAETVPWFSQAARDVVGLIGQTLFVAGMAWVIASVWPQSLRTVSQTLRQRPAASGVVGLLTMAAFASLAAIVALISALLTLICIGLLGIPILFIMSLLFAAALAVGWVAVGSVIGERFVASLSLRGKPHINAAVFGSAALTLGLGALQFLPVWLVLPVLAGIATFVLLSAGLGAATLTQLGRKPYPVLEAGSPTDGGKVDDVLSTLVE